MKYKALIATGTTVLCSLVLHQANAQVVVGPLQAPRMCPFEASREQKGNQIYCIFNDPGIVQAGIGRCPSTPLEFIATQGQVGKDSWCIIKHKSAVFGDSKPATRVPSTGTASTKAEPNAKSNTIDDTPQKANRKPQSDINTSLITADLCLPGEQVVFSCNTGKKSVAVCSAGDAVQYKFGTSPSALDIAIGTKDSKKGNGMLAGGGYDFLRFVNGKTNYIVYTAESSAVNKAGVVVEESGKRIASLTCKNPAKVDFSKLKLPQDSTLFELP